MPTTEWKGTQSADQLNPESNTAYRDCGIALHNSWCICWSQNWKHMRLSLTAHISHISFLALVGQAKSLPHIGVRAREERGDVIGHSRWQLIMKKVVTWHGAWREAAHRLLHSQRVDEPTGEVRGGFFGLSNVIKCACSDRKKERGDEEKDNLPLNCKLVSNGMGFGWYLQINTEKKYRKHSRLKVSHMPHSL